MQADGTAQRCASGELHMRKPGWSVIHIPTHSAAPRYSQDLCASAMPVAWYTQQSAAAAAKGRGSLRWGVQFDGGGSAAEI
jgi:hypothetical protein